MTTPDTPDTTERDLGRLEGRVEEQGARLDQLHAEMTAGFQQVNASINQTNARMDSGFQQVNARIDQLNARIDRLLLAMLGVGGGMLAALVGIIITLILRGA